MDTLEKMGFETNNQKSASNVESENVFGQVVDDHNGYKYLGVLEDHNNVIKQENKDIIASKVLDRINKLCDTKLNAKNLFSSINEFSLSTLNYYIDLIPFEPEELQSIDNNVRRILVNHNVLNYDYKKRHNDVVRSIHFLYTKKYGLNKNKRLKNY